MSYSTDKIRNVCLLGHGGNGKTSLAESMLFLTGGTDRLGKTPDGNTVCDYDPEEVKRQISISMASAPVNYRDHKLNVLDTPGNFDFNGEVCSALYAADTGVIRKFTSGSSIGGAALQRSHSSPTRSANPASICEKAWKKFHESTIFLLSSLSSCCILLFMERFPWREKPAHL